MNGAASHLNALLDVLGKLDVAIRRESLGGAGGGLCRLKGKTVFFLDLDADQATQVESVAKALAAMPGVEEMFVPPHLREMIDAARAK
jgi:hypothetical protein